jgi:hypothetical protein
VCRRARVGAGGLRGARVGGAVRGLRGVRDHGGCSQGVSLARGRLARVALAQAQVAALVGLLGRRGVVRVLEAAAVEGGESGGCGGGSLRWARISFRTESSYEGGSSRILRCCYLRLRESRGGVDGVCGRRPGRSMAVYRVRVLGIPAAKGDGRGQGRQDDVGMRYAGQRRRGSLLLRGRRCGGDGELVARRLSLRRALEHAGYGGLVGVGESQSR